MSLKGVIILSFIFCLNVTRVSSSVTSNIQCMGTNYAGESDYGLYTGSGPDTNIGFSYMVEDPDYTFQCCGKITQWQGYTSNSGNLQLQVWRKLSKDNYTMIGENSIEITATTNTNFTFNVDAEDQIVVNKGDFIGWHNAGHEMLVYESRHFTDSTYATMFRRINLGNLYTGDTYNWSNVEAYQDRRYALRVTYLASDAPTITLTSPVTIPDYIKNGATVTQASWSDVQLTDNSTLKVYFQKAAGYLSMDFPAPAGTGSGYLTATNTIYRPRSTTLEYFAYDTCYNTVVQTQTITVQQTAIVINNLPATVTTSETGTASELLHTITCTEPTDQWYCKSTWDTTYPFILKAITTSSYGFYKVEHATLDYGTKSNYLGLIVECVENRVSDTNTVSSSIDVYITENQPPTLINLDANIIVDANTSHRGDVVFWVNATDPEGDDLTYQAYYGYQSGRFLVTKNGGVVVTNWLVPVGNLSFTLYVFVDDTAGNRDIGYLSISLENSDYPVRIRSTPNSPFLISENTPNFTTLYKFEYDDLDHNDTKIYSLSFNNNSLTKYFSIDFATGEFRTNYREIDFEDLGSQFTYTATIMVGDQKSSATTTFEINIVNENEAPRFTKNHFVIEANENIDASSIEIGTLFTGATVDEDSSEAVNAETHEYTMNCSTETHRFYMYSNTAQIIYRGPYNIDVSGTPSDVDCQVTVTDKFGLSGTAGLYIHVKNFNEFAPQFTQQNYSAYVATNTLIGKSLLMVSAIDHDSSDDYDNEITYSVDHTGGGISLLIDISHTGIIYAAKSLASYTAGATLGPIILQAANTNHDTLPRTGTASIYLVVPQSTTTVTTTTDRNYEFSDDKRNYMWMILAVCGAAILLFTLSAVLFRVCHLARIRPTCYACCMRGICCRPPDEGPRGFGDRGYNLASFGHKLRYNDDEIDGWLKNDNKQTLKPGPAGNPDDDLDGWLHRDEVTPSYRQPYDENPPLIVSDGPDVRYADQPLYEMFRVPDNVPPKASYQEPGSERSMPTSWKKRNSKRPF